MRRLLHRLWRLRFRWHALWLAGLALQRRLARQNPEAFFVQIYANDGAMMDPLRGEESWASPRQRCSFSKTPSSRICRAGCDSS